MLWPSPKPELAERGEGGLISFREVGGATPNTARADAVIEPSFPGSTAAVREDQRAQGGGSPAPTCASRGRVASLTPRGRGAGAGPWEAGSPGSPRPRPRQTSGEAAGGAGTAGLSGGRSCSRTARRRLGAARREPRGAGGHGTPCLAACAPGRLPARDGTSSMSSGYSSLEEDAEDFFFTARTSFFRRAPQGKPRAGEQVSSALGWTPTPRVSAGRGCSQGRRRGPPRGGFYLFGCRGRALS